MPALVAARWDARSALPRGDCEQHGPLHVHDGQGPDRLEEPRAESRHVQGVESLRRVKHHSAQPAAAAGASPTTVRRRLTHGGRSSCLRRRVEADECPPRRRAQQALRRGEAARRRRVAPPRYLCTRGGAGGLRSSPSSSQLAAGGARPSHRVHTTRLLLLSELSPLAPCGCCCAGGILPTALARHLTPVVNTLHLLRQFTSWTAVYVAIFVATVKNVKQARAGCCSR